ncbi:MAG: cytochrome c [Pseudomonadota bacterium]
MPRSPTPLQILVIGSAAALCLAAAEPAESPPPAPGAAPDGRALFEANCAACHAVDGRGNPQPVVGFAQPLPDLTDCDFTSREPAADWGGVVAEGGPLRGFSPIMPAFGEALTQGEVQLILGHIYGFCEEPQRYPRGELNLPYALFTSKAFIEDELVLTVTSATDGSLDLGTALTYEKRFGTRNNFEVKVPWTTMEGADGAVTGIGDVAVAAKRALVSNARSGSILSLAAELVLPVGNPERGLGKGYTVAEPFLAYGQILPAGFFAHAQVGSGVPLVAGHDLEVFWRAVLGKTFVAGQYGRAFSPMVEVLGVWEEEVAWAVAPELHITLNQRQHIMLVGGAKVPVSDFDPAAVEARIALLWDWYDGGLGEGW